MAKCLQCFEGHHQDCSGAAPSGGCTCTHSYHQPKPAAEEAAVEAERSLLNEIYEKLKNVNQEWNDLQLRNLCTEIESVICQHLSQRGERGDGEET